MWGGLPRHRQGSLLRDAGPVCHRPPKEGSTLTKNRAHLDRLANYGAYLPRAPHASAAKMTEIVLVMAPTRPIRLLHIGQLSCSVTSARDPARARPLTRASARQRPARPRLPRNAIFLSCLRRLLCLLSARRAGEAFAACRIPVTLQRRWSFCSYLAHRSLKMKLHCDSCVAGFV